MNICANNAEVSTVVRGLLDQQRDARVVEQILADCRPDQRALFGRMAAAVCHQANLSVLLRQLIPVLPKKYQSAVDRFAARIDTGASISQALEHTPFLLPPSAALAIQLAERQGRLKEFMSGFLGANNWRPTPGATERNSNLGLLWRSLLTGLAIFLLFGFILVRLIPELKAMCEEFGLVEPALWNWLNRSVPYFFLTLFVIGVVLAPIWLSFFLEFLNSWNPNDWKTRRLSSGAKERELLTQVLSNQIDSGELLVEELSKKKLSTKEFVAWNTADTADARVYLVDWFSRQKQHRVDSCSKNWVRSFLMISNIIFGGFVFLLALSIFSMLISIIELLIAW